MQTNDQSPQKQNKMKVKRKENAITNRKSCSLGVASGYHLDEVKVADRLESLRRECSSWNNGVVVSGSSMLRLGMRNLASCRDGVWRGRRLVIILSGRQPGRKYG
jgi:hypothetical protein